VSEAAAFAAWLGAAVIVLSDGRRGLALGLALTTAGFGVLAWVDSPLLAAAAVLAGGAVAAAKRWRSGPDGWGVMPPGSTPRLILSIVGGLLALWIATSVMTGPGAPLRFAALSVLGLMGARALVTESEPAALLTALAALALSVAMASGLAATGAGPSLYIVAGLIALGVSVVRVAELNAA
jgi:hypothetical protein